MKTILLTFITLVSLGLLAFAEDTSAPATAPAAKTIYTCPMHSEVEQDHPGDCPKCGMTLVLETPNAK